MKGLSGFLTGIVAFIVTFVVLVVVGMYCLIAGEPNLKLLYASLAAFATMLILGAISYADEKHWISFPNSLYDTLGPGWVILSAVVAIIVYIKA